MDMRLFGPRSAGSLEGESLGLPFTRSHPTMKNALLLPSLALACISCRAGLGQGPYDGRVFSIELVGSDAKGQPDTLVFDGGRFESTACREYGFVGAPYSGAEGGGRFETVPRSPTSGTTAWTGTIRGDSIDGTMRWTETSGKVSEFRFQGKGARGPIDGRVFAGHICPAGTEDGDPDTLVFQNGAFDSQACRAWGFTRAPYATTSEGGVLHFTAVAINADGERNHWNGILRGDELSGTMEHRGSDGEVQDRFDFVAHAQPSPAQAAQASAPR